MQHEQHDEACRGYERNPSHPHSAYYYHYYQYRRKRRRKRDEHAAAAVAVVVVVVYSLLYVCVVMWVERRHADAEERLMQVILV